MALVISVLCKLRGTKDKKILQPPLALHLSFSYIGGCRLDKCRKKIRSLRLSGMEKLNRFSLNGHMVSSEVTIAPYTTKISNVENR